MERTIIFLVGFIGLLMFLLLGNVIYLGKQVNKLDDIIRKADLTSDSLYRINDRLWREFDRHEENIKKIQAEVLAKDILKEKEQGEEILANMKSVW